MSRYCVPSSWLRLSAAGRCRQRGQALAEALVVCLALLMLWAGSAWLARLQNMALQAQHAAGFAAFAASRSWPAQGDGSRTPHFFQGASHDWRNLAGHRLLQDPAQVRTLFSDEQALLPSAQAGKQPESVALARQLHVFHNGMHTAQVQVQAGTAPRAAPDTGVPDRAPLGSGVRAYLGAAPVIRRHVAIITGAGHAATDHLAAFRLGESELAWASAYSLSGEAANRVNTAVAATDAAWGRAALQTDWLQPWRGDVPDEYRQLLPSSD